MTTSVFGESSGFPSESYRSDDSEAKGVSLEVNGEASTGTGSLEVRSNQRNPTPVYPASSYRSTDYRPLDPNTGNWREGSHTFEEADTHFNWMSAVWRYRFALLLPILLGIALSGAFFTTRPNIYRSTARLVVETQRPWTPDPNSTDPGGIVPPADLLLMQLHSEPVLDHAARHPLLADAAAKMSFGELRYVLSEGIEFEKAMTEGRFDRAIAFFLHFDDQDPQFSVNAVTALSEGLRRYFADKSENSVSELKKLITTAKDKLLPELNDLEMEYRAFRENTELSWDKGGLMINPYRDKQLALQVRRTELEDQHRDFTTKLAAITGTIEASQDPLLVMEVVQQLLGEEIFAVRKLLSMDDQAPVTGRELREEDVSLATLIIEKELLPLEIEREQFAAEFGAGHPSVRTLDQQLVAMKIKLRELTELEKKRLTELRIEGESPSGELLRIRRERAELAVTGFVRALETRRSVLEQQMAMLDQQMATLGDNAVRLARAESENAMYLRKIERAQKLFDQVEEQITRINLADKDGSIHVTELNSPTAPDLVSPILIKFLAVGGLLGGLAGLGLVYLLESLSKTYRTTGEISDTLGLRVIAHIPTDSHKLPKVSKGEVYAYENIDPGLSAVHRPRSATSEAVRKLRTSVFFEANAIGARIIQVTSPLPEDGKSTLAANLAVSIAHSGKSVVIVDADLRRPQMTSSFNMESRRGLTELIDGSCDPTQVLHHTAVENLSIVPCGPIPANPAEALSMPQFGEFLQWLRDRFDYVIVDTPPLLIVTDPSIVASCVEAIVFTFRVRRGCRPQTKEAVSMLHAAGTPVLGCVVNRVDQNTSSTGYQGFKSSNYYYGRKYNTQAIDKRGDGSASKEFVVSAKSKDRSGVLVSSTVADATDD